MGTLCGYAFFANRINPTSDTLVLLIYLESHLTLRGSPSLTLSSVPWKGRLPPPKRSCVWHQLNSQQHPTLVPLLDSLIDDNGESSGGGVITARGRV